MKRVFALIVFLFLFTGCSGVSNNMDRALSFRQTMLQQKGCRFDCNLTADYGDVLYQFVLSCEADSQGNVSFTVAEPESISGISGTISGSGGKIQFDDTVLGFPILSENLPTPLSAPWLFVTALRSGHIRTSFVEKGKMALTIADTYEDDAILMQIQFDEKDHPTSCEFVWEGRRILSMLINSFTYL